MERQQFLRIVLKITGRVPIVALISYPYGSVLKLRIMYPDGHSLVHFPFSFMIHGFGWFWVGDLALKGFTKSSWLDAASLGQRQRALGWNQAVVVGRHVPLSR